MHTHIHAAANAFFAAIRPFCHPRCHEILFKWKIFMNECVGTHRTLKRMYANKMLDLNRANQLLTRRDLWNSSLIHDVVRFFLFPLVSISFEFDSIVVDVVVFFLLLQRKCVSVRHVSEWVIECGACVWVCNAHAHTLNELDFHKNEYAHFDGSKHSALTLICEDRKSIEHKTAT